MGVTLEEDLASQRNMPVDTPERISSAELLGEEVFNWVAPDGSCRCTFGRAKGVITPLIAKLMGNTVSSYLEAQYRALLGIRTWNDLPAAPIHNDLTLQAALGRFGSDENFVSFIVSHWEAMNPEAREVVEEAMALGYGPEAMERVQQNLQKQSVKK